jgi:hypothetical protein
MGQARNAYVVLIEILEEEVNLGDLEVDRVDPSGREV